MAWYEEWFESDAYDLVYRNRDDQEADDLVSLVLRTLPLPEHADVLDVGCGRGRHAVAFARRGCHVTGMDLSERALTLARQRAEAVGANIHLIRGDMREPVAESAFDLVVNLFTAFGYFTDPEDNVRAVRSLRAAARPGGWVVQDFMNAPAVAASLVPHDERTIGDVHVRQERRLTGGRVEKTITLTRDGDVHAFTESVELLTRADFEALYDQVGLRTVHCFGDYAGNAYHEGSPRLILMSTV